MNRKLILLTVLALLLCPLWAGDTAVFVDLGFSPDGKTYMFGQYGVSEETLRPWADLHVVDVPSNSYVPGGRINYVHDSSVTAGHDGSGALFRLIARNTALTDRYRIGYLLQGRLLYVSTESNRDPETEAIEFRNFEQADSFKAVLQGSGYGSAAGSSFSISLERRNSDGSYRTYTAGNAGVKRPGIVSYQIHKVLAAPLSGSLIFVIEMKKLNADGSAAVRYMVETLKL